MNSIFPVWFFGSLFYCSTNQINLMPNKKLTSWYFTTKAIVKIVFGSHNNLPCKIIMQFLFCYSKLPNQKPNRLNTARITNSLTNFLKLQVDYNTHYIFLNGLQQSFQHIWLLYLQNVSNHRIPICFVHLISCITLQSIVLTNFCTSSLASQTFEILQTLGYN